MFMDLTVRSLEQLQCKCSFRCISPACYLILYIIFQLKEPQYDQCLSSLLCSRFPLQEPGRLQQWLRNMGRENWTPSRHQYICHEHFAPSCFKVRWGIRYLESDAVPTVFQEAEVKHKETYWRLKYAGLHNIGK